MDSGDVGRRGERPALVPTVTGGRGHGDARVVVVRGHRRCRLHVRRRRCWRGRETGDLGRRVDSGAAVREGAALGFDQRDVAVRARGLDHVEVERDLLRPAAVGARV
jgi:hypothetical protein